MTQPLPRVTRDELLRPVTRWTTLTKFWICDGIRRGTITAAEACSAHQISGAEMMRWYTAFTDDGFIGLRKISNSSRRYVA